MTPLNDPDLARRLEALEAGNLAAQIDGLARAAGSRWMAIPGGVAARSGLTVDRKLNHAVGFGMAGPVTAADLAVIESFVGEGVPGFEIDLCPCADPSTLAALDARHFRPCAFSHTLALELRNAGHAPWSDVTVRPVRDDERDLFISLSADGFGAQARPRPRDLLESLAASALARTDTWTYIAESFGEPVGTCALALVETPFGSDAHLFLASTLPAARGKGAQAAMIATRVAEAKAAGAEFATITVRPGTSSGRNAERGGFAVAYSKTMFVRR